MTKTFEELEAKVDDLAQRFAAQCAMQATHDRLIAAVNIESRVNGRFDAVDGAFTQLRERVTKVEQQLFGDTRGNGWIDRIEKKVLEIGDRYASRPPEQDFVALRQYVYDEATKIIARVAAVEDKLTAIKRIEAFFAPLMASLEGRPPPLDGNQVVTKAHLDKLLETLARNLRSEIAIGKDFVELLHKNMSSVRGFGQSVVSEIVWLWTRERARFDAEEAALKRPSRLSALAYAITGRNGAR